MTASALVRPFEAGLPDQTEEVVPSSEPGRRPQDVEWRRKCDEVVDRFLIPWANGQIDIDSDLIAPTAESVRVAAALAHRFRDAGEEPPAGAVPDGDGGIHFEYRVGRTSVQSDVPWDGDVSRVEYAEGHFVRSDLYPASQAEGRRRDHWPRAHGDRRSRRPRADADLTHAARQSKDAAVRQRLAAIYGRLVGVVLDVEGPFPGKTPVPPGEA
jgi:hypothetical protein